MTFVSAEFALLLAATLSTYYFLGLRARQVLLLVASYVFYAYWNPAYAWLILASTSIDYIAARSMETSERPGLRKLALSASLIGNLGMLAYFKYTNFALESLHALLPFAQSLPTAIDVVLPVGISFYTFQTLSYSIDVYRRERQAERDFVLFALFVSFFPQLMAGPIERASDLLPQLNTLQKFRWSNIELGTGRILWGLLKKAVVGDRLGTAAFPFFLDPGAASTGELAFAALGMFVVVYLDFSAYADLARGIALLFGVRLSKNFDFPHAASNVAAYWRRWHITLATWLRDYVAQPLGGTGRGGFLQRSFMAILITGLIGLWHGAEWTFVTWGLANGASIIVYNLARKFVLCHLGDALRSSPPWAFLSWGTSTSIRAIISVLFFAPSFALAGVFYQRLLLSPSTEGFTSKLVWSGFLLFALFWTFHYTQWKYQLGDRFARLPPSLRGVSYSMVVLVILFAAKPTSEAFIYFQF